MTCLYCRIPSWVPGLAWAGLSQVCTSSITQPWPPVLRLPAAGNVVELILSIAALQAGLYDVVATSLLGSILSNLLLVLGMSFFVGGLK